MELNHYIEHPELLDRETLYTLRNYVALYPCHQAARLLMLQNLYVLHDPTFDDELRRAAFYITDRTSLFNIVEAKYYQLAPAERAVSAAPTADPAALIDSFLDSIPSDEAEEHTPTVVDATKDYMGYIMSRRREPSSADASNRHSNVASIIDTFLEQDGGRITIPESDKEEADAPHVEVPLENDKDDLQEDFYTESLAKVYVKQGNYSKALEIITQLNLNKSEKSSYFADQMRFLEKAIAAKKRK